MNYDKHLIQKVASLARLTLTDDEADRFLPQLGEIIEAFSTIASIDTEKVQPSFHPIKLVNRLREDTPKCSLSAVDALKNSSQNKEGYFKGPRAV